jgi:hypothetical protein
VALGAADGAVHEVRHTGIARSLCKHPALADLTVETRFIKVLDAERPIGAVERAIEALAHLEVALKHLGAEVGENPSGTVVGVAREGAHVEAALQKVSRDSSALLTGRPADEDGALIWMLEHGCPPVVATDSPK